MRMSGWSREYVSEEFSVYNLATYPVQADGEGRDVLYLIRWISDGVSKRLDK